MTTEHERDPCPPESLCWRLKATIRVKDADFQRVRADREKLCKVSDDLCGAALTLCTDLGIDEDAFLWQKIDAYCDYLETVGQHSLRRARQSPPASVQDLAPSEPAALCKLTPDYCDGRYPVPQTSPPREEAEHPTYRCALPKDHGGPHGPIRGDAPTDRIEALLRIEAAVREIEIICDEFDFDPIQWLIGGDCE